MSTLTATYSQHTWLAYDAAFIFVIVISVLLLKSECVGKHENTKRSLRLWCISCILSGLLIALFGILHFVDYTCNTWIALNPGIFVSQLICMGYFQLSRLYYCFGSSNAYPNSLFIVMFLVGALILIDAFLYPSVVSNPWHAHCGMDFATWTFTEDELRSQPLNNKARTLVWFMYLIWDMVTVSLYAFKLFSFRKSAVDRETDAFRRRFRRIMFTLTRILILTTVYEFSFLLPILLTFLHSAMQGKYQWLDQVAGYFGIAYLISMNMCVYLMRERNTHHYTRFVKLLRFLKCDVFCCCCCRSSIAMEYDPTGNIMGSAGNELESNTTNAVTSQHQDASTTTNGAIDLQFNELELNMVEMPANNCIEEQPEEQRYSIMEL